MQTDPKSFQNLSIAEISFSESFKLMANKNNLEKLVDLLNSTPEQLMSISGLTFEHLKEYRAFLDENGLDHLQKK